MAHTSSLTTNTTSPSPFSSLLQIPLSTLFPSLLFQKHQQNLTTSPLSAQPSPAPLFLDLPSLITTIACISISLILLFHRRSRRICSSYPPGPAPWPIVGNIPSLGTLPHRSLAKLADRFGPIFTVWFGPTPCVVISSPDLARAALKAQDRLFSNRPLVTSTHVLTLGGKDIAFAPPDQAWKKRRRLAFLHLLSARQLAASAAQREEEVRAMVDAMAGEVRRCQHPAAAMGGGAGGGDAGGGGGGGGSGGGGGVGCVVNMRKYLGRATLNNILRLTVGKRDHLPWLRWMDPQGINTRVGRVQPAIHGFGRACIRERAEAVVGMAKHSRARTEGESDGACGAGVHNAQGDEACGHKVFVDFLLERQGACSEGGRGALGAGGEGGGEGAGDESLDEEEMVMLVMDMILAGTDTTAKTVEWALAELVNHPHALKGLQDEVDAAYSAAAAAEKDVGSTAGQEDKDQHGEGQGEGMGEHGGAAGEQKSHQKGVAPVPNQPNLSTLPFLQAVIKETLRHHPVAPLLVPHKTTESTVLGGRSIPAGTMVLVNTWAISHDSRLWDHPQEFDPWRFMPPLSVPPPPPSGAPLPDPMAPPPQPVAEQATVAPVAAATTALTPASWDPSSAFLMLPFGGGRRGCAGMALGVDMAARMLAALLLRFHMAVPANSATMDDAGGVEGRGGGGCVVELGEVLGLTMAMEKPLRLLLWEREERSLSGKCEERSLG
ncbi:unnamed protein product [Closterium sp. NIES-64]|nr:unnamed protein product [Closterium sp. NIES-64]